MPSAVVQRLQRTVVQAIATPDTQNRLAALGADAQINTPAEFAAAIAAERAKRARIVQASGARAG